MEQIIITSCILKIITYFVLASLLLFMKIPRSLDLKNYVISRRIIAFAYLCLVAANFIHLFYGRKALTEFSLLHFSAICIFILALQALLFTYSLITLIDACYVTRKRILSQLVLIGLFYLPVVFGIIISNPVILKVATYFFSAYYFFLLLNYTRIFSLKEKEFIHESDSFFSDNESKRIKWVNTIFYIAIYPIGIGAFVLSLLPNLELLEIIFSFLCIIVYFLFAVKYINYVHDFYLLKPVIVHNQTASSGNIPNVLAHTDSESDLRKKIQLWINDKKFARSGITLAQLAEELNTNRTYLSTYINTHEALNFNTWLNTLRIEEAKSLMTQYPDMSLAEVAQRLRYKNQSTFSRLFTEIVGESPFRWKKKLSRR